MFISNKASLVLLSNSYWHQENFGQSRIIFDNCLVVLNRTTFKISTCFGSNLISLLCFEVNRLLVLDSFLDGGFVLFDSLGVCHWYI